MGVEILRDHVVNVDLTHIDKAKLMAIRNGEVSYDELVEGAERLEALGEELYKTSTLRQAPDRAALDKLLVDMTERYLRLHG